MISTEDLYLLIDEVTSISSSILSLSNEIEMIEGLLAAMDLSFDNKIFAQKELSNDAKRKSYREMLRCQSASYQENLEKIQVLKQDKNLLLIEKETKRQLLEVGKLEIRLNLQKQELTNNIN